MSKKKSVLIDYFMITMGVFLVAIGIYFFKFPNNFSTGGVSGISIILGRLLPGMSPAKYIAVINVALLIIGFLVLGKGFTVKTVYGSLLLSGLLNVFESVIPMTAPMTSQPLLELVFAVLLPAIGSAVLFNRSASTGGTDIVAMILKKYSSIDIGKALFCTDAAIAVGSFIVFGAETGLFSIIGLISKALIVDAVIENINLSKYFIIVTEKTDEICDYIKITLHRGATKWDAEGVFSGNRKGMLLVAMGRYQAVELRKFIKEVDPGAFIIVANTSEVIGKGFRGVG